MGLGCNDVLSQVWVVSLLPLLGVPCPGEGTAACGTDVEKGYMEKQHGFTDIAEDKPTKYLMLLNSKTKESYFYFLRNMNKWKYAETSQ